MAALIGRYEYALDPKNRMFVPPRYREHLAAERGAHFILSMGLDSCLYLFLPSQWERIVSQDRDIFQMKDKRRQRALKRSLFSNAMEAPADEQGRILVPQRLKEFSGLSKDVVVVGMGNKAEIWDKRTLNARERADRGVLRSHGASLDL